MPQRKKVTCLEDLSLKAVPSIIINLGSALSDEHNCLKQVKLETFQEIFHNNTSWYLYDKIAEQCLLGLEMLLLDWSKLRHIDTFKNEKLILKSLVSIISHPKLKRLKLARWSRPLQFLLLQNLNKMTGLEVVDFGSCSAGMEISQTDRLLQAGGCHLKNLTSLILCSDCTNGILKVICENCKSLCHLDVTNSRSVTDRSVNFLMKCKKLQKIELYRTSVSPLTYYKLITESEILVDIGRCDNFGEIIMRLEQEHPTSVFPLKSVQCSNINSTQLNLMCQYFPNLSNLTLFHDYIVPNLANLSDLQYLSHLQLSHCNYFTDGIDHFLSLKGFQILSLDFDIVNELQMRCLCNISQYCPNIESIKLYRCSFFDDLEIPTPNLNHLKVKPFQKLKKIHCISDCTLRHLEFILRSALYIERIEIRPAENIIDSFMINILSSNPLKYLKELRIDYVNSLSLDMLKHIVLNCDNISILHNFSNSAIITPDELLTVRNFVIENNYDIVIT